MAGLTVGLKNVVGQPRPPSPSSRNGGGEFGMPSNHSSVSFFGATFVILYVLLAHRRRRQQQQRGGSGGRCTGRGVGGDNGKQIMNGNLSMAPHPSSSSSPISLAVWLYHHLHTTVTAISSLLIASGCAYSRIYLQYHTPDQVYVGSILGIACGMLWYALYRMDVVQAKLNKFESAIYQLEKNRLMIVDCGGDDVDVDNDGKKKKK